MSMVLGVCAWSGLLGGEAASFPFEFSNGLIWVKVSTAGPTLNFVLDSGAGSTVLSLRAARRLGVELGSPVAIQAVNGRTTAYRADAFAGSVGGVPIKREIFALELRTVGKTCRRPIDGLIGQDFFRDRVVRINFKTRRICLLDKADVDSCCAVLPLRYHRDAMCVPVGVNGLKPEWTRLDTGCDSALEWAADFRSTRGGEKRPAPVGGKTGTEVQMGSERIAGIKTGIHKQPIFLGEAGLLGSGLLSRYCVTVDARKMQLLLQRL